ncbi:hypothetical protein [Rugamonas aquatica]|nr:hypothetical protein [Rugamonas aquatica]
MSQQSNIQSPPAQQAVDAWQFYPVHVMTRLHYEALAREAAGQK